MTRKLGSGLAGESPKIVVRLSDDMMRWLTSYCLKFHRSQSDAVRIGIDKLRAEFPDWRLMDDVVERSPLYGDDVDVHQEQVGEGAKMSPNSRRRARKKDSNAPEDPPYKRRSKELVNNLAERAAKPKKTKKTAKPRRRP
jgi:hypothetical protein